MTHRPACGCRLSFRTLSSYQIDQVVQILASASSAFQKEEPCESLADRLQRGARRRSALLSSGQLAALANLRPQTEFDRQCKK